MNYLEGNIHNLTRIGIRSESKNECFTVKIKPLREIPEKEIATYVLACNLPVHLASCPYAGDSFRAKVGVFLKEISKEHPTIMYSTLRGFDKIKPVLKKNFHKKVLWEFARNVTSRLLIKYAKHVVLDCHGISEMIYLNTTRID